MDRVLLEILNQGAVNIKLIIVCFIFMAFLKAIIGLSGLLKHLFNSEFSAINYSNHSLSKLHLGMLIYQFLPL